MSNSQTQVMSFRSDGLNLAYRKFGRPGKTPILLLHGLIYSSYDWIQIALDLAEDREVVALDQRGFGDSDWSPSQSYKVQDFADDAARLAEHMNWDRCIVVGHSMGGRNAACAALSHPERVAGLVLVDCPPAIAAAGGRRIGDQLAGVPKLFKSIDEALRYFPTTPWADRFDPTRRARFEDYLKPVAGGYAVKRDPYFHQLFFKVKESWPYHSYEGETWPMGQEFDAWAAWETVQCPTLAVIGRAGDCFSPETAARAATIAKDKNPNFSVIEHWSHHNIPGKIPKELVADIRSLARKIDGDDDRAEH